MNIELFKKIRDAIEAEPSMYIQASFGRSALQKLKDNPTDRNGVLSCDTPGCIAGHAVSLAGWADPLDGVIRTAYIKLGLGESQSNMLFATTWPIEWMEGEGPLPDGRPLVGNNHRTPRPKDAIHVLNRIIEHGFDF